MRRVLVVAYYAPPLGMSGVMRVTKLVKFLPRFGWEPVVLSVRTIAYPHYDPALLEDWPGIQIHRAHSLDPARLRYLLLRSRHMGRSGSGWPGWLSNVLCFPDAKAGWCPFAISLGERIIKTEQPSAIFATAPPYSALAVGLALKRLSGLPLVADFRDPWPMGFVRPPGWQLGRVARFRRSVVRMSDAVLAVNQGTASLIQADARILPNGFDPDEMAQPARKLDGFGVVYVGNLWGNEDEFCAVVRAASQFPEVRVRLVGGMSPALSRELRSMSGFEYLGQLSHRETISLMKGADLLLYLGKPGQPAGLKFYEYLGANRPVLAVSSTPSEAEELVIRHGVGLVRGCDEEGIKDGLRMALRGEISYCPSGLEIYNREHQARQLAETLDQLTRAQTRPG
ncbi:MAG: glycosyltransferase [candidate division WOR-3 bacterium]